MTGGSQQEHCTNMGEKGHTEICEQIQGNLFRTIWRKARTIPRGHSSIKKGAKTYASLPLGMIQGIQQSLLFRENAKGLQSRRHRTPEKHYGKGPEDSCANATGIFTKHGSRDNASDEKSQCAEGNGWEGDCEQSDKVFDDGVSGFQVPESSQNTRTTKMQVTNVALQNWLVWHIVCYQEYISGLHYSCGTKFPDASVRSKACSTADSSEPSLTRNTPSSGTTT